MKDLSEQQLEQLKAEMEKKFVVTARLIESVMDAVEKISSARKCVDDIKGIQLLKGELKE
jgi:ribosomal protein S13